MVAATAAAVMMLAAACGGGDDETPGAGPLPTDSVELTFWWWGSAERAATTQQVIDLFEKKYPFIHVKGEPQDFANYFANLSTKFAASDAPDVITMGGAYVLGYAADGNLADLGTLGGELDTKVFPTSILQASTYENKIYGVPTGGNAIALMANKSLFDKLGVALPNDDTWTWEQFTALAKEISTKAPSGTYGAELRSYDYIGAYAAQQTPLYDDKGNLTVTEATLTTMWELEKDLLAARAMPPADLTQQVMTVEAPQTLFGQGRSAMFFGYTNQVGTYAAASGNDIVLLRIPGESQYGKPGTSLLPSQYYTVNGGSKYQRQAALFVDFLVNDEEAGKLILADRGLPSNPKVRAAIAPLLSPEDQRAATFIDKNNDRFGPSFVPPSWATDVNRITQTIDSQVLFGQLTPAQAAAEWIKQMTSSKAANS